MAEQSSSVPTYRFFLGLFIVHPTLVPEEISIALGMEADVAHRVGAPRRTPRGTPLPGTNADTRWRRSMEHVIEDQWFASEVSRLIDKLRPHKAFFADVKSGGGKASIVIQFMEGFLADELSSETLARLVDLDLSLAIECFAGLQE
ncbi:DUF4279 domain-containing protein [Bradyrhizobium liaoningense]|nr:DUF4279 domain-containing protein [Bradyrhizobium sp. CCBAU 45389]MBR0712271.1 DUF4279 domain-containing protein [Bradyrhizobium liaoningense]